MRFAFVLAVLTLAAGCGQRAAPKLVTEEGVAYSSGKEMVRGIAYRPAGAERLPALIVVHEDRGLTLWVKEKAQELAQRGYLVLAVDLYRGEVVDDLLDAHIMDRGLPEDRVLRDLKAAVDYLAGRPDVKTDGIGILGWDSGGGYALDAAINDPRLQTAVVCYGRLTTDPARLATLHGSVFGVFAGKDEGISTKTIEQFQMAMKKAGKRLAGVQVYPDCPHGFMNPANQPGPAGSNAEQDAWLRIYDHLEQELKPG